MRDWHRQGDRVTATFAQQEAAVLRGLVRHLEDLLSARADEAPQDELAELTGMRAGPTEAPEDPVLSRLLPDFHRLHPDQPSEEDQNSAAALRSLHEPQLIEEKLGVAEVVLDTLPAGGGEVDLDLEQADAWLSALNDVRLALGTVLDIGEETSDEVTEDHPQASHFGVYHWLTYVQEGLVQAVSG
ncbi:DUF2017 domain-containing protein [Haloechinothrix sp. LS1_15]|uniref:DUF2017 domain-containing protein n=1 Tax=Haloechinothrix sp. LS1_15 TaxID=2652248 RepID=UPI002946D94B|nr:DUF2017 domain-containing protein [Haloechinothrix sp. LS1_15]MDV6011813.1 DUF2017 domain-containing protein [Haloechinothrix sp. LS1_15]